MCNTPFPFHLPCSLSLVFHLLLRPKQNNFSRKADHITSQSLQINKRTEGAPRVLLHLWLHRARFVFSTWSRMSFLFLSPSSRTALIHLFTRELFNCSWLSNPRSPNIFVSAQNEFHTNQMKWKMNRKNKKINNRIIRENFARLSICPAGLRRYSLAERQEKYKSNGQHIRVRQIVKERKLFAAQSSWTRTGQRKFYFIFRAAINNDDAIESGNRWVIFNNYVP